MRRRSLLTVFCLFLFSVLLMRASNSATIVYEPPGPQDPQIEQSPADTLRHPAFRSREGKIAIANRASGTISIIDVSSDRVIGTHTLPAGSRMPEPMYVVYSSGRVFVGDRANNQVIVFNPRTFVVESTVPAGAGIWHMWADPFDRQLWVNNDIDKTCTVIDPSTLQVLATVPIPADLAAAGGKPHDVILDPVNGQSAYVTLIGVAGAVDYVVKFSTQTFLEVDRAAVGKDPHLSAAKLNDLLYVPCQNSNLLIVLNRETLAHVTAISIPGAHGAGMAHDGHTFYTTNFPSTGSDGLWTIDTTTNTVIGEAADTKFATPHNIALTPDNSNSFPLRRSSRKLYLTHSGATADKVTVYKLRGNIPVYHREVTVGFNPFGLAYVPE